MAKVKHLEAILRKVVEEEKLDRREQFVGKLADISPEVIPEWIYKLIVAILGNIFQIILVSIVLDLVALMLDGAGGGDEEEGEGGEGGEEGAEGEEGAALPVTHALPAASRSVRRRPRLHRCCG